MKIKIIIFTGLLTGSLDIIAASIDFYIAAGNGPAGVPRSIASGAFGNEAFTGGNSMILWGLFIHYLIACSFTVLFFWLYLSAKFVSAYPIITAILYGMFYVGNHSPDHCTNKRNPTCTTYFLECYKGDFNTFL